MLAALAQRLVQAGCFLVFLTLFFIVCWPYDVRQQNVGKLSAGWRFRELDQTMGELHFSSVVVGTSLRSDDLIYFAGEIGEGMKVAAFRLVRMNATEAILRPDAALSSDLIQDLMGSCFCRCYSPCLCAHSLGGGGLWLALCAR